MNYPCLPLTSQLAVPIATLQNGNCDRDQHECESKDVDGDVHGQDDHLQWAALLSAQHAALLDLTAGEQDHNANLHISILI